MAACSGVIMSIEEAKRRILSKSSLVDLIKEQVALTTKSGRPVGLCPFHEERSPSFFVYDQHYYCFGCKAHGDAISFVRQTKGLSFMEALRYLAQRCGDEAAELESGQYNKDDRREEALMFRALQLAQQFFVRQFLSSEGEKARKYLLERGYQEAVWAELGFGFAPDQTFALVDELRRLGIPLATAEAASLIVIGQKNNRPYDFYQNRVTIPIHDKHSRIIGFGGRTLGDDPAKYKNSREGKLFDKSSVLFGFHKSREYIRKVDRAIVVEGYMDTMQLWLHGFPETVACLGTALTSSHLRSLTQLTKKIYLCFDGDKAGINAVLRVVSLILEMGQIDARVIVIPDGDDPDDFLAKRGHAGFVELLHTAPGLLEFAINKKCANVPDMQIPDLIRQDFVPWLQSVRDPLQRTFLINRIAELTRLDVKDLKMIIESAILNRHQSASKIPIKPAYPEALEAKRSKPLQSLEKEFFGHLFFAAPGELDVSRVTDLLRRGFDLEETWQILGVEWLTALEKGETPDQVHVSLWESAVLPEVMELVSDLRRTKPAFAVSQRGEKLHALALRLRQKSIKQAIGALKVNLVKSVSPEENRSILGAIQQLNNELLSLSGGSDKIS